MTSNKELKKLLKEVESFEQNIFDFGSYRFAYFIAKNQENSSHNEDTLFFNLSQNNLIMGVADGAGGHARGKDAAIIAGKAVIDFSSEKDLFDPLAVIENINNNILNLKVGAASTLALVVIYQDHLRCFSTGDSEIIFWNAHGREIYSNIPHSNTGYQIEAGLIKQEESLDDPERYQVNNMLGDLILRVESTTRMVFKKNQTLLIGSDGLFDNFTHRELSTLIGTGPLEASFEKLTELCRNPSKETWKKDDDISFIVVRKIQT